MNPEELKFVIDQFEQHDFKTKIAWDKGNVSKIKARKKNIVITVTQFYPTALVGCRGDICIRVIKADGTVGGQQPRFSFGAEGSQLDTLTFALAKAVGKGEASLRDYKIVAKTYGKLSNNFKTFGFGSTTMERNIQGYWPRQGRPVGMHPHNVKSVQLCHLISRVDVIGVVAIDSNGKIDEQLVLKPDETPWFYLSCRGPKGDFVIISDGDRWHPVNTKTNKLTSVFKIGQRKTEPTEMSGIDYSIIQTAIKYFLE